MEDGRWDWWDYLRRGFRKGRLIPPTKAFSGALYARSYSSRRIRFSTNSSPQACSTPKAMAYALYCSTDCGVCPARLTLFRGPARTRERNSRKLLSSAKIVLHLGVSMSRRWRNIVQSTTEAATRHANWVELSTARKTKPANAEADRKIGMASFTSSGRLGRSSQGI
jgi:hypothetical protein